jgi:8-hydroxy-5-deazaflavin:NADPH oxidoreductase
MRIAVFGTGVVGRVLAAKLADLGHDVTVGTRDPQATLDRAEPDRMGTPPFAQWRSEHESVALDTYAGAAAAAELVINATAGAASLAALDAAGADNLQGKVVLDVANVLDFSAGFPPTLSVANTDSLGEQIQRAFPTARVVKGLNTVNCLVMVEPSRVPGDHQVFVAGEDESAKRTVTDLVQTFGWPAGSIIDLGGIRAARATEMYMPLWLSLMQTLGHPDFNINVVRRPADG